MKSTLSLMSLQQPSNPAVKRDAPPRSAAPRPLPLRWAAAMTAMSITRVIAIVVSLTVCSLCAAEPMLPFGVFSNKESADGEHWGGWEIRTWSQSKKLVGFVSLAEGLIGDEFSAPFQDLQFDSATGRISFWAHLPVLNLKVQFSGALSENQIVGAFVLDNGENSPNVTLKRCCDDAPLFRRYESFEDMTKEYELQPNPSFKRDALKRAP